MFLPVKSEKHLEIHKGEVVYIMSTLYCSEGLYLWAIHDSSLSGPAPSEVKLEPATQILVPQNSKGQEALYLNMQLHLELEGT